MHAELSFVLESSTEFLHEASLLELLKLWQQTNENQQHSNSPMKQLELV
jgi:hypothetical protein